MGNPPSTPPPPPPAALLTAALHHLADELPPRSPAAQEVSRLAAAAPEMDPAQARDAAIRAVMGINGLTGGNAPTPAARKVMFQIRQLCNLT